jgi:hypothetical protein
LRDVEKPSVEQLRAVLASDLDAEPAEQHTGDGNDGPLGASDDAPHGGETIVEVSEREART